MSAVLQLREELSKLKQRKMALQLGADASIRAAKELLATSSVTPLQDIELKDAAAHLGQAIESQDALTEVLATIRKIERELGI